MTNGTSGVNALPSEYTQLPPTKAEANKKSSSAVSTDQFLQLLVTQLKNQDPLNPMEDKDFSVQLAQFSSLEQLVSINDKISPAKSDGSLSSMASYLGTEVRLNSKEISVRGSQTDRVAFKLDANAQSLELQLLDANGSVVGTKKLDAMSAGRHSVDLSGMTVPDGVYSARLNGVSDRGSPLLAEGFAAGVVTGFIPGDQPKLLIGDKEVSPEDILEVRAVS